MIRASIALLFALAATTASAQGLPIQLSAGWTIEVPARATTTLSSTKKDVHVNGPSFGIGLPQKYFTLEVTGGWRSAVNTFERIGDDAISDLEIVNRDIPLTLALRSPSSCYGRWCAEAVGGGGRNFRQRSITTVGQCALGAIVHPCPPVERPGSAVTSNELTVVFGADMMVRVSDRLSIGPTFRFWHVWRHRVGGVGHASIIDRQRVPDDERIEIGATVVWRVK